MMIDVDMGTLAGTLAGAGATLATAFWTLGKILLAQSAKNIESQFVAVNGKFDQVSRQFADVKGLLEKQDEVARHLERELMQLKAELPREYVRREDFVQQIAVISTKLDAMQLRFENILMRQAREA